MPTYAYRCSSCNHEFEQFQRFSDDPLTICPECQGLVRRVLQPVGVVFKGSGWYITDSRKAPVSESGGSDKAEKTDKSDKSDKPDKKDKSETVGSAKAETTSTEPAKPKAAAAASD